VYYRHLASRQRRRRHVVCSTRVVNVNAMTACACVCVCVSFLRFLASRPPRAATVSSSFRSVSFRPVAARMHALRTHVTHIYVCTYVCVCCMFLARDSPPRPILAFLFRRAHSDRVTANESRDLSGSSWRSKEEQETHHGIGEAERVARTSSDSSRLFSSCCREWISRSYPSFVT